MRNPQEIGRKSFFHAKASGNGLKKLLDGCLCKALWGGAAARLHSSER